MLLPSNSTQPAKCPELTESQIASVLRIATAIAGKWARNATARAFGYSYDDLRGAAIEGAVLGAARFDPTKKTKWSTWVWAQATYSTQHFIRDNAVGVGRPDWDSKNVQALPVSLDEVAHLDGGDPGDQGEEMAFDIPDPGADPEALVVLKDLVERLPAAHRAIIALRYAGLDNKKVARRLGISAAEVDSYLDDAWGALRDSGRTAMPGTFEDLRASRRRKPAPPVAG